MNKEARQPLVSICIPTYNGAPYLSQALESAKDQTYPNLEIVISDDASTDNTLEIVERFKTKCRIPLRIFKHSPQGIGVNWNHCVSQAQGEYIKFLFQDDVLQPTCIQEMMNLMLSQDNVGLVYCKRYILVEKETPKTKAFIQEYGNLTKYWEKLIVQEGIVEGREYLKDRNLLNAPKNKIGEPTAVLLSKIVFNRLGYFDELLQQTLDCEYWYRVMTHFRIGFLDKELVGFRLHKAQASTQNKTKSIPDKLRLYKCYYTHLYSFLHPENKWKLLKLYHPVMKRLVKIKQVFYVQ